MTQKQELKIIDLYKELNSTNKVADLMNCSRPTVSSVLKKYGVLNRMQQNNSEEFKEEIVKAYTIDLLNTNQIKEKFHIGKPKIKEILQERGIEFRKEKKNAKKHITEYSNDKYPSLEGTNISYLITGNGLEYRCKTPNVDGFLTKFCKESNLEIPKNDYQAREEFCKTGNYWWEKYFTVEKVDDIARKKCPYCDWSIEMEGNWKLSFIMHIRNAHKIKKEQFLKDYESETETFKRKYDEHWYDENSYITCVICGKRLKRLDNLHLKLHGINKLEYLSIYNNSILSKNTYDKLRHNYDSMQKYIEQHPDILKDTKPENEIKDFIRSLGITEIKRDRKILEGNKEIDIYIPSHNIAIEFNGCYWHTEKFKDKKYHLNKTLECEEKGIKLIQIFEDEYINTKNIVFSKIRHALKMDYMLPKIMGRKCVVKEINALDAEKFLKENHIQQFASATVYLGAFYEGKIIGVMSFIRRQEEWELNRLATDNNYLCQGVASKLFKYFTEKYHPEIVKSFADRRWTLDSINNIYTILNFKLEKILPPDYRYYSPRLSHHTRFHKFGFRKQKLSKNYNLPMELTEMEMCKRLGIEKIWDCGLLKYVWRKEE